MTLEPRGFQWGDMTGNLPGTHRHWEIEELEDGSFTVWFAGCEHGGDFPTYEAAIGSIRPMEEGD